MTRKRRIRLGRKERREEREHTLTVGAEKRNPCFADHERERRAEAERTVEEV
jgi:hypothetical protein